MNKRILLADLLVSVMLLVPINSAYSNIGIQIDNKPINPTSRGNIFYVGGSGLNNYTKIQDAIDDASDGDTVFVYNGTYYENVEVDKSINLIGEDRNITKIINDGIYYYAVDISADYVNINGFTIKGFSDGQVAGIEISGSSSNNTIIGNLILDNDWGIHVSSSSNNIIKNNNLSDNAYDIILKENCMNNTISGNTLFNTCWCYSIGIQSSSNNIISDNTFSNSLGCECGCIHLYSSDKNVVMNNTMSSMPGAEGISIQYSKENIIIGNTIKDLSNEWRSGIYLRSATDNTITSNNLICCYTGISAYEEYASNGNTIHHNNFINNTQNAYDECSNEWDNGYPSGGNYWDDYDGIDDDGDGIGETPYNISGGDNQDRYPLIEPWGGNLFPIPEFTWTPTLPEPEESIFFDASKSIDYDGNIILYEWDWDNDGIYDESYATPTATHTFEEIGYYPVTLRVKDDDTLRDSKTKTVRVGNQPPYVPSNPYPTGEFPVDVNVILSWDGGDPDPEDTVTYTVYIDTFPPATVGPYPASQTRIEYDPGGLIYYKEYYWHVVAEDNHGLQTEGPIWSFNTTHPNQPPDAPTIYVKQKIDIVTYEFNIKATDPDDDGVRYFIDWDDGNTEWTDYFPSGFQITVNHTFNEIGYFRVKTRANDTHGALGPWGYIKISKDKTITNSLLLRFLERFPLLRFLLDIWRLNLL